MTHLYHFYCMYDTIVILRWILTYLSINHTYNIYPTGYDLQVCASTHNVNVTYNFTSYIATESGQSIRDLSANPQTVHPKSSHQTSANHLPCIRIPILTSPENDSKWESRMKVHFMGIAIISLFIITERL